MSFRRFARLASFAATGALLFGCGAILDGAIHSATKQAVTRAAGLEVDPSKMRVAREPAENPLIAGTKLSTRVGATFPGRCASPPEAPTLTVSVTTSEICLDEVLYDVLRPRERAGETRSGTRRRVVTASGQTDLLQTSFASPAVTVSRCRELERGGRRPIDHRRDPEFHPEWGDEMVEVSVVRETRRACAPNAGIVTASTSELVVKRALDKPDVITLGAPDEGEYVAWSFGAR